MTNVSKLKTTRRLGKPPSIHDASSNLSAPEIAPAYVSTHYNAKEPPHHRDGRTLRKTNRTIIFAVRVTQELNDQIRSTAEKEGLMLAEVFERAWKAYMGDH